MLWIIPGNSGLRATRLLKDKMNGSKAQRITDQSTHNYRRESTLFCSGALLFQSPGWGGASGFEEPAFKLALKAKFHPAEFARLKGLSLRQLERIYKRTVGFSPQVVMRFYRHRAAMHALHKGRNPKDFFSEFGYASETHYYSEFKSIERCTPSEFVIKQRSAPPVMSRF